MKPLFHQRICPNIQNSDCITVNAQIFAGFGTKYSDIWKWGQIYLNKWVYIFSLSKEYNGIVRLISDVCEQDIHTLISPVAKGQKRGPPRV